jgi:uncharacterized protein
MTDQIAIAQTQRWVQEVVVGCNFCPFAGRELLKNTIRYTVVRGDDLEQCLEAVKAECERLTTDNSIETTLLLFPDGFFDFEEYLDLVDLAERLVVMENYEGVFQVASFHPEYLFGGSDDNDPANFTNRSMIPMLHLLRESSVTRAVENHPNVDDIPAANISFAQAKGLEYMQKLRSACANVLSVAVFFIGAMLLPYLAKAQNAHPNIRQGNHAYEAENYPEAEENYRKGLEKEPNSLKSAYNLGNALYHQKRYDEAVKQYEKALPQGKTQADKAMINYNMGNALMAQNKLKESINAYKNALKATPNNESIKQNLNIAVKKLRKQQQQQQQNNDKNGKNPPPKDGAAQEKQQPKEGGKEPKSGEQKQEKGQQKGQARGQTQGTAPTDPTDPTDSKEPTEPTDSKEPSKEQARELLRIMDGEEKKVQTKLHKYKGARAKNGKDW